MPPDRSVVRGLPIRDSRLAENRTAGARSRSGVRSTPVLMVPITMIVIIVASCNDSHPTGTTAAERTLVPPVLPPIYQVLEDALGMPLSDVTTAINRRQVSYVKECVEARGFVVVEGDLPDDAPPAAATATNVGPALTVDPPPGESSPEKTEAIGACLDESLRELSNPFEEFQAWILAESKDISARVDSDERLREALAKETECLAKLGVESYTEALEALARETSSVMERSASGELSKSTAETMLADLARRETELRELVRGCTANTERIRQAVFAEYQAQFVEENAEAISEEIARLMPQFEPFIG